ncbi:glyoxylase-like metal-dependent hydrolase (beta-lactamase superfamily II) [Saccharopolyspora lacisalsi]|uniref:Glyoxylase-like metal-dependent hydrolase (Beta-lactamase superfamily II) n=1 Tax=Halosaccharopolyspora lacisalsi TaxID=1000566 RepID=A0A839E0S6_9PSEU|nr:MBL fold metallo-hydrolase [Halosaccharopolyspora lacisalsi]MBA8825347.1 glyoxylase-like metal-dependent hydrolase (beta-lactamase superfamily II) [Halosaccharopolyspora lacisalsi]
MGRWVDLGDGVLVRRYAELDLSVGLVVGDEWALVIDTRGDREQGAELATAVREITPLPWKVVLTHGHFDHCFGTEAFLPAPVWAHEGCVSHLERTAAAQRDAWTEHYREQDRNDTADALARTVPVVPDHLVHEETVIGLGGRSVRLSHPGKGHTDHDLVAAVEDSGVVFTGDLVESGGPPDFEDAHPSRWPHAVDALLESRCSTLVPGHGDPVGPGFATAQRDELAALASLCSEVSSGAITADEALCRSPLPAETTRTALRHTAC